MLISFEFENFRSVRDRQEFTMSGLPIKSKQDNAFEIVPQDGIPQRILKSAIMYGANGSGKTNFVLALKALKELITRSSTYITGHPINVYEPFELEQGYSEKPCRFNIVFVMDDNIRYNYELVFDSKEVILEKLDFYSSNQPANLFKRERDGSEIHEVVLGKMLANKRIAKTLFSNQVYLSRFGSIEPHEHLTRVFKYFEQMELFRSLDRLSLSSLSERISRKIKLSENRHFSKLMDQLMVIADEGIKGILIDSKPLRAASFEKGINIDNPFRLRERLRANSRRHVFKQGKIVDEIPFELEKKESTGTNILFALGGMILYTLEKGGLLVIDEFNNGLHPKLTAFLIRLFHDKMTNPKNAQFIINTHDISLLDKELYRSDQIWFVDKDKYGVSELYSAQDFEGVREDIPFGKWYMAGKFNAIPKLKNASGFLDNESE